MELQITSHRITARVPYVVPWGPGRAGGSSFSPSKPQAVPSQPSASTSPPVCILFRFSGTDWLAMPPGTRSRIDSSNGYASLAGARCAARRILKASRPRRRRVAESRTANRRSRRVSQNRRQLPSAKLRPASPPEPPSHPIPRRRPHIRTAPRHRLPPFHSVQNFNAHPAKIRSHRPACRMHPGRRGTPGLRVHVIALILAVRFPGFPCDRWPRARRGERAPQSVRGWGSGEGRGEGGGIASAAVIVNTDDVIVDECHHRRSPCSRERERDEAAARGPYHRLPCIQACGIPCSGRNECTNE